MFPPSSYMRNINEKIILYRIRTKHDHEAFAELYDKYVEKIYRFIYFKISHKHDAEDLTSEAFLKVWNYLTAKEDRKIQSFSGLIYGIARNNVIDWYRDRAKKPECGLDENIVRQISIEPMRELDAKYDSNYLLKLIKTLKQEYREIVLLRYIEELPIKDIALIVGKKKTAVRVVLHRAIKKLKSVNAFPYGEAGAQKK